MSTFVNTLLPKICHARVGEHVRLPDEKTGVVQPEIFLVVAKEEKGCRSARDGMSHGLYDDERQLMLVSLQTGVARAMPHLSSRAEIIRDKVVRQFPEPALTFPSVPDREAVVVQLASASRRGKLREFAVNLADVDDVRGLLEHLTTSGAHVVSIQEPRRSEAELISNWRLAVAGGETLQSFQEYKQANA